MGKRRHTGELPHSVEGIRAHEVRRLLSNLSLSPEQREAVENLNCSLVEELVHGPISEVLALVEEPSELGVQAAEAQQLRSS